MRISSWWDTLRMRIPDVSFTLWLYFLCYVITQVCFVQFCVWYWRNYLCGQCLILYVEGSYIPNVLHISDFIEYDDAAEEFHPFIKFFATFSSKVSKTPVYFHFLLFFTIAKHFSQYSTMVYCKKMDSL